MSTECANDRLITVHAGLPYNNRPFYSWVLSYLAMNASGAEGDLALIQTSLLFSIAQNAIVFRDMYLQFSARHNNLHVKN